MSHTGLGKDEERGLKGRDRTESGSKQDGPVSGYRGVLIKEIEVEVPGDPMAEGSWRFHPEFCLRGGGHELGKVL